MSKVIFALYGLVQPLVLLTYVAYTGDAPMWLRWLAAIYTLLALFSLALNASVNTNDQDGGRKS